MTVEAATSWVRPKPLGHLFDVLVYDTVEQFAHISTNPRESAGIG
jgi:hypothetical protein